MAWVLLDKLEFSSPCDSLKAAFRIQLLEDMADVGVGGIETDG